MVITRAHHEMRSAGTRTPAPRSSRPNAAHSSARSGWPDADASVTGHPGEAGRRPPCRRPRGTSAPSRESARRRRRRAASTPSTAAPRPSRSPRRCRAASAGPGCAAAPAAAATWPASASAAPGTRRADDRRPPGPASGWSIQWYRQRRFSASCRSRVRFEVSTAIGGTAALMVPISGHGDRPLGQQLEQERLEILVGAVDLVDQQHGGQRPGVLDRAQQRPVDAGSRGRTGRPRRARCRRPRPAGSRAAAAGSSTRTAASAMSMPS